MSSIFPKQILGTFIIQHKERSGSVIFDGANSKLDIYSDEYMHIDNNTMRAIHGIAQNGAKISICECVGYSTNGTAMYYDVKRHYASYFPHYVALGRQHIHPDTPTIRCVRYTFQQAISLFYDRHAFGSLNFSPDVAVVISNKLLTDQDSRPVNFYDAIYYVDRGPIIALTWNGISVSVYNAPSFTFPSAHGAKLENEVFVDISFPAPVSLVDALHEVYHLHLFFCILMQSKQPIPVITLVDKDDDGRQYETHVYISMDQGTSIDTLDFREFLISGGMDSTEFAAVFLKWLSAGPELRNL